MMDEAQLLKLGFAYVGRSTITVWYRPNERQVALARSLLGITMVVCLLGVNEHHQEVEEACAKQGLKFVRYIFPDASEQTLKDPAKTSELFERVSQVYEELCSSRHKVLIHCGCGIHRSGVFAYCLLRKTGLTSLESIKVVRGIRYETFVGIAEWRVRMLEDHVLKVELAKKETYYTLSSEQSEIEVSKTQTP